MLRAIAILLSLVIPPVVCAQTKPGQKKNKPTKPATFKVIKIGEPVSYLGHYCGTVEIQKAELVKIDSLRIKYCFNVPSEFTILKYKFSAFVDGQYFSYAAKGCALTPEIKNVLERTRNGDKIKFTGIVAVASDSSSKIFQDIVIKVLEKRDTNLITYKLKNKIPEPGLFSVRKKLPTKISKLEIMFFDQLKAKCDCKLDAYNAEFHVIAFDLRTTVKGYKVYFSAKGSDLTQEMREALLNIKTGTKFHIENIRVKTPDGIVGYLSPRTFKVIAP